MDRFTNWFRPGYYVLLATPLRYPCPAKKPRTTSFARMAHSQPSTWHGSRISLNQLSSFFVPPISTLLLIFAFFILAVASKPALEE